MKVRVRDVNINTPTFWDETWVREPEWTEDFGLRASHFFALAAWLSPPASVLDVGGGRGEFLGWLGSCYQRTILDHSAVAVETALRSGRAETGIVADCADPLPFPDGAFDAVFCSEVLEHVEDPAALVSELLRVSNGIVGVTTPHVNTVDDRQHIWSFDIDDLAELLPDPTISIISGPTIVALART